MQASLHASLGAMTRGKTIAIAAVAVLVVAASRAPAPVSWLVVYDVHEAREHLNFSAWNRYDRVEQREKIEEVWGEVEEGEMPLWYYLPLHPDAALSAADQSLLRDWAEWAEGDSR